MQQHLTSHRLGAIRLEQEHLAVKHKLRPGKEKVRFDRILFPNFVALVGMSAAQVRMVHTEQRYQAVNHKLRPGKGKGTSAGCLLFPNFVALVGISAAQIMMIDVK